MMAGKITSMLWCAVIMLIGLMTVNGQSKAKICDVCSCLPSEPIQSVTCVCNNITKNIETTQENMRGLSHIKTFSVVNCDSITFNKDSFVESHDLESVTVSHVGNVTFPLGVFSSLSLLKIEDVEDLRLEEKAFMGVDVIREISIRRTVIKELFTHSLFEMRQLRRFELTDVSIGHIITNAIKIEMSPNSIFVIDRCKVDEIDSEAIVLKTDILLITNSSLAGVSADAVNVSAVNKVDIIGSQFGNSFYENTIGLVVNSNSINIDKNIFDVLPIGILNSYEKTRGQVTFTNNLIYNFTLDSKRLDLTLIDFNNNLLICNCDLAKSVLAYQALMTSNTDNLVENNYCQSKCGHDVSLKMLSQNINSVCSNVHDNIDFLCNDRNLSTPLENVEENVNLGSRFGKSFDEDFVTTPEPWMAESEHQHANSNVVANSSSLKLEKNVFMIVYLMFVITIGANYM